MDAKDLAQLERYAELHPDDEDFAKRLSRVRQAYDDNPLLDFRPLYEQQKAFLSAGRIRIKLFAGGNQSGKTVTGLADDLIQCVDREALPEHLRPFKFWEPPFRCRVVTPSLGETMESVQEKLRELVPKDQLVGGGWDTAYAKSRRSLQFKNGSYIQFLASEQDVDKHAGWTGDRVHFDEEPPGEHGRRIFQESSMRILRRKGQLTFTMTPSFGMSWIYDDVWMRALEEPDRIFAVQADMDLNPTLDALTKREALSGYSEEELAARKEGKFVHFAGLVFPEFDEDKHVVDPPKPEHLKEQKVIVGIDPGIRFTGVVWGAFDKENDAILFDELILRNATPENVATLIKDKNKHWDISPRWYVIDPSARNRATVNADQVEAAYARAGIRCAHGQNSLEAGCFEVKRRLQGNRITIARNMKRWLWERARYRHDPKPDGSFGVLSEDDHVLDASRYLLMASPTKPHAPKSNARRARFTPNFAEPFQPPVPDSPPLGILS